MILATLCYIRRNGRTLMLHRIKKEKDIHEGKWNGLGGKMLAGETPEECVIREVREESGLTIKSPKLRGILTFPKFDAQSDWMAFVFTAEEFDGIGNAECDEGKLEWIEDSKMTGLPLWEGDPIFLEWIKAGRFFSGKFCYEKGKLKSHNVVFYDI
jgi:8-oxo-dGTP diphosphatase